MSRSPRSPLVYSTEAGAQCPKCGWPKSSCRCSSSLPEAVPARIVAKLRMERAGRGGKTVTVVDGLPRNPDFLKDLCSELKRALGTGGKAAEASVEIQGEHREAIGSLLKAKGWTVKG